MVKIIGLGAGDLKLLTLEAYQSLQEAELVYLRTEKHPAAQDLKQEGIEFNTFDYLYQKQDKFEVIYEQIAREIIELVQEDKQVVYAVPGHPLVAEESVQQIINNLDDQEYQIIAGPSFLELSFAALGLDPISGLKVLDGLAFSVNDLDPSVDTIICQVYNRNIASEIKLKLMEIYPDQFKVKLLHHVGLPEEKVEEIELYQLDRLEWIDHLTSLYLPVDQANSTQFNQLLEIMETLRGEDGCPWDQKQDHQTLKKHLIEESYEVIERIEDEDYFGLAEELGDLLLQVVFHAQIAKEEGPFTIYHVITEIIEKLIRRHPHVFGELEVENENQVISNWEEIKEQEAEGKDRPSLLEQVPNQLPALMLAQKVQKQAAKVGFDWTKVEEVLVKVDEELLELKDALKNNQAEEIIEELGDLIFAVVNLGRFLEIDTELCLRQAVNKFKKRFNYMERQADKNGQQLEQLTNEELEKLWQQAKKELY
ncbi:nucleoside triphosphate pyrophosphohydrolase [Natroniella sulfidigena]|uniref:nucleoside triphosphate pyrophosphohydrolase n=1 Tax=Natroniella sulfidigena TaxID=723921 RepID=UPI00200A73E6|nr:nucleoside triphosphate pyrophosphohydrolase [Natroniella sulfidigena]MCK8817023.1 nucleoside triphosphate pyrophosphohydrolase [Natroniella sulfidigena]